MEDIWWGEVKVTIEKIEDPNLLNEVSKLYEKAKEASRNAYNYRAKLCVMHGEREALHNEEYNALWERLEAAMKNGDYWKEGSSLRREMVFVRERADEILEETKRKYDEIHGREYDTVLENFGMYESESIMYLEKAEKILIESGINSEAARELRDKISDTLSDFRSYKESILRDYARK